MLVLAPDLVEKEHQIAILHGSRTPVVPGTRPNKEYVVMGHCSYDGAVYAEMADPDHETATIITLI